MPTLVPQSAEVRMREIDLSQTLVQESSANAGMVFVSKQGRLDIAHILSPDQFLAEYGNPDPRVSFGHHCALDFFREGNSGYFRRVVNTDAVYANAVLSDASGTTTLATGAGMSVTLSPLEPDWSTVAGANTPICVFLPQRGPGSYADNIAVRVSSANLKTPSAPSAAIHSTSGGSLGAATYNYYLTAISSVGETLASSVAVLTIGSGSANQIALTWTAIPGATGYRIYGRVSGGIGRIATVGANTTSYIDTGSVTPDTGNLAPSVAPTPTTEFKVEVFDLGLSATSPQEIFNCTLENEVDQTGAQMELTQRINPFSQYVKVVSNVSALLVVPTIWGKSSIVNLGGGDSGSAPTTGQLIAALQEFLDTETVNVDLLINAGITDVTYKQAMDAVAQARGTTVALLDIPPVNQGSVQDMIDYRNLDLNINSSFSALFGPDVLETDQYNGTLLYVPFSGWAAALCARTDRVAAPWFAIAGLNRGLVSIQGMRVKAAKDSERTALFDAQVNYVRNFVGAGTALWEQVTLQNKHSALSWLNVRRLCNVIKKSVYKFLIYSIHEQNDDFLRRQIVSSLTEYLRVIQDGRGISNFQVVSNESNNPPALYNAGQLKVSVFITPIIPVHEILLDLIITKAGVEYSEINIANLG